MALKSFSKQKCPLLDLGHAVVPCGPSQIRPMHWRGEEAHKSINWLQRSDIGYMHAKELKCYTLDLSELSMSWVMSGNNGAHQRSPYDPGIQKRPFFFVQTPESFFTSMKLSFASYIMSSMKVKKNFWGQDIKEKSFLNPWVIRRTLVYSVVSGHDFNIKFW